MKSAGAIFWWACQAVLGTRLGTLTGYPSTSEYCRTFDPQALTTQQGTVVSSQVTGTPDWEILENGNLFFRLLGSLGQSDEATVGGNQGQPALTTPICLKLLSGNPAQTSEGVTFNQAGPEVALQNRAGYGLTRNPL